MEDKVIELYETIHETIHKPKTIGDLFYDDLERKIRKKRKEEEMLDKLIRESKWKNSQE